MDNENYLSFDENPATVIRVVARGLRAKTIYYAMEEGQITEEQALELLFGNLSPDDMTTFQDDRHLLEIAWDNEALYKQILEDEYATTNQDT